MSGPKVNDKVREDWEDLPKPDLNWEKLQRILWQDLSSIDVNITRNSGITGNPSMVLALVGMRAHVITALAACETARTRFKGFS